MTTTATKERPIIFNGESVRAILAGRKVQTRRVVKDQPEQNGTIHNCIPAWWWPTKQSEAGYVHTNWEALERIMLAESPYGQPGDQLWVKESFYIDGTGLKTDEERRQFVEENESLYYRADGDCCEQIPECQCAEVGRPRWTSPLFMPRWASRLTLEVTEVRVERLRSINWLDAVAEGCQPGPGRHHVNSPETDQDRESCFRQFFERWDGLNAKRGFSAESNPWVWAVTFKDIGANPVF